MIQGWVNSGIGTFDKIIEKIIQEFIQVLENQKFYMGLAKFIVRFRNDFGQLLENLAQNFVHTTRLAFKRAYTSLKKNSNFL